MIFSTPSHVIFAHIHELAPTLMFFQFLFPATLSLGLNLRDNCKKTKYIYELQGRMPQAQMVDSDTDLKVGGMGHESLQALAPDRPDPRIMLAIDEAGGAGRDRCQLPKSLDSPRRENDGDHRIHCQLVLCCCQDVLQ